MTWNSWRLMFAAVVVLSGAACGSEALVATESANADISTTLTTAPPSTSTTVPAPEQAPSNPPDEDLLCAGVDEFLDLALSGRTLQEEQTRKALEHLSPELADWPEGPTPITGSEGLALVTAIDEETTERCGIPFFNWSIHLSFACSPEIDMSDEELDAEGLTGFAEWQCIDPRTEPGVVADLAEQVQMLDELATHNRAEFERMAAELEG